jgi:tetratricopeptide (TPR) repeat protein
MTRRSRAATLLITTAVLLAVATAVQMERDRLYAEAAETDESVLYVQSPAVMRKAALSFDSVLADVYWIRALQHYGYYRLHQDARERYRLLYPLLDLATSLDPNFNVAYRFGAIFLSEPDPGGAGRPDLGVVLLEKGVAATPEKWQYYHDIGFIYYWHLKNPRKAAEWFKRGGDLPGSPWWLRTYAAVMLTKGGDRQASRAMWNNLLQTTDNDWVRKSAQLRLTQLDALDQIDALARVRDEFTRRRGRLPESWQELTKAGLLRGVPVDPTATPYTINFATGRITVAGDSRLYPLPTEPAPGEPAPPATPTTQ